MKKSLIIGMLVACSFQMSFAAPTRTAVEVKDAVTKEIGRNNEKATAIAQGRAGIDRLITNTAGVLSQITKGRASVATLRSVLNKKVTIKEAQGDKVIDLLDIGQAISKADEGLRNLNRNELDANGKAHLAALENAIQVAAQFMTLAARTSDMGAVDALTPQQKLEVAAFNEQLALIPDVLTKMDLGEVNQRTGKREPGALDTHVEAMRGALAARTSPEMTGDQAFAIQMKKGKSDQEYLAKLNELINCAK